MPNLPNIRDADISKVPTKTLKRVLELWSKTTPDERRQLSEKFSNLFGGMSVVADELKRREKPSAKELPLATELNRFFSKDAKS